MGCRCFKGALPLFYLVKWLGNMETWPYNVFLWFLTFWDLASGKSITGSLIPCSITTSILNINCLARTIMSLLMWGLFYSNVIHGSLRNATIIWCGGVPHFPICSIPLSSHQCELGVLVSSTPMSVDRALLFWFWYSFVSLELECLPFPIGDLVKLSNWHFEILC